MNRLTFPRIPESRRRAQERGTSFGQEPGVRPASNAAAPVATDDSSVQRRQTSIDGLQGSSRTDGDANVRGATTRGPTVGPFE